MEKSKYSIWCCCSSYFSSDASTFRHFILFLIDEIGNNCLKSQRHFKYIHGAYGRAYYSIYLLEQQSYYRHTSYNVTGLVCDKAIEQIDNHLDQSK